MRLANGTADVTGRRNAEPVVDEVAQLRVPALRPVPITAADGGLLPWGAMTDAQRDTWSAWSELDGGELLASGRDANFLPSETTTCVRPAVPPEPANAHSTKDLHDVSGYEPDQVEMAVDRLLRGSRDGKLIDAVVAAMKARRIGESGRNLDSTVFDELEESALTGPPTFAYDGDGNGYLGSSAQYKDTGVRWSTPQVAMLLDAIAHRAEAWRTFLVGLARQQAHDILAATKQRPAAGSTNRWAARIAAMDALLGDTIAFPGNGRIRGTVASFPDVVIAAIDGRQDLEAELDREHPDKLTTGALRDGYKYSVIAGYVKNGVATPPVDTLRHGTLPPPVDLPGQALADLYAWASEGKTYQPIDRAVEAGDWAFTDRIFGCCKQG